jgi:hypothetical protein
MWQVGGALTEVQFADASTDCPGTDQRHPPTAGANASHLIGQRLNAGAIQPTSGIGQDIRADFHHHGFGSLQNRLPYRIGHACVPICDACLCIVKAAIGKMGNNRVTLV